MKKAFLLIIFFANLQASNNVFQVSIPKAGTHLLLNLLRKIIPKENKLDMSYVADQEYIICNHEPATPQTINEFAQHGYRGIFIYRDPRDVIVSAAYFTNKFRKDRGQKEYSFNDLITHFIQNDPSASYPESRSFFESDVVTMFKTRLGWMQVPFVYTTTFEKLVGPAGEGSEEVQFQEIKNILEHLNIFRTDEEILKLCREIHGSNSVSWTFRNGTIGAWKKDFTAEHKQLFKQKANNLLIELGYEADDNW